ncbi:energy-coupling factor transporter transmembrane component T family protein [Dictyoglomus thermophilum]|uniref:Cobalt transport protein CbiQ n=1 Tax=Dictyoglomus thermophilum (strain ATCC 35947 / DSM 3960 / H-6-12) TaxID=309799 RepID=B5YDX4_DICT6|nr:energy-coupling factor transporter transmembrane component T [Dictyoglomus thermophilum]ACI19074.1 cobalt transport protein CbiQ [Dictyoglomus thermophilum H-6-12]TYT20979.1 energy-coupling factor transporter transmembrane protein EcfT [Dictyoglomus thermophilum]
MEVLKTFPLGQYIPADSLLHKLDAKAKILASFWLIVFIFLIKLNLSYLFVFLLILLGILFSSLPFKYFVRSLKPVYFLVLFTFIIHFFFGEEGGKVFWRFGIIHITELGIKMAVFMSLRLVFIVMITSLLTLTTSVLELAQALEDLLNPLKYFKFPVHEFSMMMTIAIRFVPTLLDETDKIIKAQKARGAEFGRGNLINQAKSLLPIVIPLFINAFRRANELAEAMESRCYRGAEGRTRYRRTYWTSKETLFITFIGIYTAIIIMFL